ncbi:MAG TPA: hypothetical protein VMA37_01450 [Acetobacteraceae bacterium]|nr:hypothetical protein [Acetobacteraceae bacterium]
MTEIVGIDDAIVRFAPADCAEIARQYVGWRSSDTNRAAARSHALVLWGRLSEAVQEGTLRVVGIRAGTTTEEPVADAFLAAARVDFDRRELSLGGIVYTAVRVRQDANAILDGTSSAQGLRGSSQRPRETTGADRRFMEWAAGLNTWPTKREAEEWAKENDVPPSCVRALQRQGNHRAAGRPRKRA